MIRAYRGGWDAMAAALGFSRNALENRIYEKNGQGILSDTAMQMQSLSETTYYAEAIASLSGGTFVKLPALDHIGNEEISDKFHELIEEFGEISTEWRGMTKDGKLTDEELDTLNTLTNRMHVTLDTIRALTIKVFRENEVCDE
jgi:hypothetical protein